VNYLLIGFLEIKKVDKNRTVIKNWCYRHTRVYSGCNLSSKPVGNSGYQGLYSYNTLIALRTPYPIFSLHEYSRTTNIHIWLAINEYTLLYPSHKYSIIFTAFPDTIDLSTPYSIFAQEYIFITNCMLTLKSPARNTHERQKVIHMYKELRKSIDLQCPDIFLNTPICKEYDDEIQRWFSSYNIEIENA